MNDDLGSALVLSWGPLQLHEAVITTWLIMAVLVLGGYWLTRRLEEKPGLTQTLVEGVVLAMENAIAAVDAANARRLLPLVGSLWVFLVVSNLLGVIPALHSPTRNLSVTVALALIVFFSVHYFGLRQYGWRYFRRYLQPNPVLLPFHLISELTRTLALAVRLFGNMMSLELAALLILLVAGFLAPVPILMLHVVEALVQAYIFGMLALIYITSAMQQEGGD